MNEKQIPATSMKRQKSSPVQMGKKFALWMLIPIGIMIFFGVLPVAAGEADAANWIAESLLAVVLWCGLAFGAGCLVGAFRK